MLPLRTLSYTLTILLLSSCSVTKSLYKDKEVSRYNPNVSLASKNYSKPAGEDTSDKEAKASGKQQQPVSDSLPETETHKKLPYRYPLPRMTFGETESANVRIPMSLNNPFPPSGELEIPLAELESDFCYPIRVNRFPDSATGAGRCTPGWTSKPFRTIRSVPLSPVWYECPNRTAGMAISL